MGMVTEMTICFKSDVVNGHCIHIEQDKYDSRYRVTVAEMVSENMCGFPISVRYYATMEQAEKRFAYLKRKWGNVK